MRGLAIISIVVFLFGCQQDPTDTINIQENLLVVDGWIYSDTEVQKIFLSRSVAFQDNINGIPISNATVIVRVNSRQDEVFTEKNNGEYISRDGFRGRVGNLYQLEIRLETGERYQSSPEVLFPVPGIDTLIMEPLVEEVSEPAPEPRLFFPVAFIDDFEERGNFYRWKLSKNGIVFNEPSDIILQSDRFVNGNSFRNEFKEYQFLEEDSTGIRLESLTRSAYDFLRFFRRQTVDLGTSGGTSPGALRGNLTNVDNPDEVVLGYFGTSDVSVSGKRVQE